MRLLFLSLMMMVMNKLSAQENYLLVGTYTGKNSEGIYVYKFDTSTGAMEKVSSIMTENPSYLVVSKDKKFVYSVNENGSNKGGVSSFSFDEATGKLVKLNSQLSH